MINSNSVNSFLISCSLSKWLHSSRSLYKWLHRPFRAHYPSGYIHHARCTSGFIVRFAPTIQVATFITLTVQVASSSVSRSLCKWLHCCPLPTTTSQSLLTRSLRPLLHGNGSVWNRTRTVRIGLAFTRELMEPFHIEPPAVPELVHLESRSRTETNQKFLCKLPEPFSSCTLRSEASGNSTEDS